MNTPPGSLKPAPRRSIMEVFGVFLRLGCMSFGGPVAHLAYFHREFVERRAWLGEHQYAQLLALCQFLPGPASSQFGFAVGQIRAGWPGAVAAFIGFTLPSAVLLFAFALFLPQVSPDATTGLVHGLKLVALIVVAQAVMTMSRQLCPDGPRATIAVLSAVAMLLVGETWTQLAVIGAGALAGLVLLKGMQAPDTAALRPSYGSRSGVLLLALFALLLFGLPLAADGRDGIMAVLDGFYRAGALVFGGGHVVLPLLEETVVAPGWLERDAFLAGYGAAQAVPGPMFTIATYMGALLPDGQGGIVGATVATLAIFLPGFLLLAGVLPLWGRLAGYPGAAGGLAGVNAAVVGLLAAALYDPVWIAAVRDGRDLAIALVGFLLVAVWRLSPLYAVLWCVTASIVFAAGV